MKITEHLTRDNAIFAAKVAAGIVITGAAIAGTGYLMQAGGEFLLSNPNIQNIALKTLGTYMKPAGEYVFLAGKCTAYTILVPAYTLGYELPKWVIKEGIPQSVILIHNYVIQPATQTFIYVKDQIFIPMMNTVIQVANDYLWSPLKDAALWAEARVVEMLTYARDHLLYPLCEKVSQIVRDYFFIPLRDAACWMGRNIIYGLNLLNDHVITPLCDLSMRVAVWARDHLLYPLCEKVSQMVRDYFFIPLRDAACWMGRNIIYGLNLLNDYVITPLCDLSIRVAVWAREHILLPTINGAIHILSYVAKKVSNIAITLFQHLSNYVLIPLKNVVQAVWNEVRETSLKILRYSWEKILMPAMCMIGNALFWSYVNIVQPIIYVATAIFSAVVTQVVNIANWGYGTTLEMADLSYRIFQAIKNDVYELISKISAKRFA